MQAYYSILSSYSGANAFDTRNVMKALVHAWRYYMYHGHCTYVSGLFKFKLKVGMSLTWWAAPALMSPNCRAIASSWSCRRASPSTPRPFSLGSNCWRTTRNFVVLTESGSRHWSELCEGSRFSLRFVRGFRLWLVQWKSLSSPNFVPAIFRSFLQRVDPCFCVV